MDFASMFSGAGGGGGSAGGGSAAGGNSTGSGADPGMFSQKDSQYQQGGDAVTLDYGDVTTGGGDMNMGALPGQQNTTLLILAAAAVLALLLWRKR